MTPVLFHLLLALAEGEKHGYALLGDLEARTGGKLEVGPSSLYYSLGRLEGAGLIRRVDRDPSGDEPHEEQRRYYAITDAGRDTLEDEVGVLSSIVDRARAIGFTGDDKAGAAR
jgi:DNA-binding PadR family transcriptional regulator